MPLVVRFTGRSSVGSSYPEGNFGGSQLLDSSMSLSPLYPSLTKRFARQHRDGLPPGFPGLHPAREEITIFRVPTPVLKLKSLSN